MGFFNLTVDGVFVDISVAGVRAVRMIWNPRG
jgi:hypothetical protein